MEESSSHVRNLPCCMDEQQQERRDAVVENAFYCSRKISSPTRHLMTESSPLHRGLSAAIAGSTAEFLTFSLDTVKTRQQATVDVRGSLYRGWAPAVLRAAVNSALSVALYSSLLAAISDDAESSLLQKAVAASIGGALTQCVASPVDVLKVRMQTSGMSSMVQAAKVVYFEKPGGIAGFWNGLLPSMARSAAGVSATLASYDHCKQIVVREYGFQPQDWRAHLAASAISGFAASVASCPFDVVKTQLIVQSKHQSSLIVAKKLVREHGVQALFRGFLPTYLRLGPWQLIFFLSYERISTTLYGTTF